MNEKKEQSEVKLVPCSRCSAPVLPNLTECMFCGQQDPGKLASNRLGERFVNWRHNVRQRLQQLRASEGDLDVAAPLNRWADSLGSSDTGYPYTMIAASVILFVVALLLGANGNYRLGATGTNAIVQGRLWTPLTAIYLHSGIWHIAATCLWLYRFSPLVIGMFSRSLFFLIFTISGLVGFIVSNLALTPLSLGASGAIFGLMGAMLYTTWRENRQYILRSVAPYWGLYVFVMVALGLSSPIIDNLAHLGGFAGGIVCGIIFADSNVRVTKQVADKAAIALLAGTGLSLFISLITLI